MRPGLQEGMAHNITAHTVPYCSSLLEMHFFHLRVGTRCRLKTEGWGLLGFPPVFTRSCDILGKNCLVTCAKPDSMDGHLTESRSHKVVGVWAELELKPWICLQKPTVASLYVLYVLYVVQRFKISNDCLEKWGKQDIKCLHHFFPYNSRRQLFLPEQQKGVLSVAYKQLQFLQYLNNCCFVCGRTWDRQEV